MRAYACIFPTIQFEFVRFFLGLPFPQNLGTESAFTEQVGDQQQRVHIRESAYDPCSEPTFLTIAHELVHVLQIQSLPSAPGLAGFQSTTCFIASGFSSEAGNCLEEEAYRFANGLPGIALSPTNGALAHALQQGTLSAPCSCDTSGRLAGGFPV